MTDVLKTVIVRHLCHYICPAEEGVTDVLKTVIPVAIRTNLNQSDYQR